MTYIIAQCLAACIGFTVVVWTFLLIRFYVRWRLQKELFVDDIFVMLATVCLRIPISSATN